MRQTDTSQHSSNGFVLTLGESLTLCSGCNAAPSDEIFSSVQAIRTVCRSIVLLKFMPAHQDAMSKLLRMKNSLDADGRLVILIVILMYDDLAGDPVPNVEYSAMPGRPRHFCCFPAKRGRQTAQGSNNVLYLQVIHIRHAMPISKGTAQIQFVQCSRKGGGEMWDLSSCAGIPYNSQCTTYRRTNNDSVPIQRHSLGLPGLYSFSPDWITRALHFTYIQNSDGFLTNRHHHYEADAKLHC
ncbi:hypothetical protein ACRALDRAFT_207929 [Sodiomyces alcalophilus JCM 7366]|uniref:uncharacterized protein n=1 Tax=Sodiomyces alcalophilus JCM 7366 TaxID=591952 RepID=UPI0039B6A96B